LRNPRSIASLKERGSTPAVALPSGTLPIKGLWFPEYETGASLLPEELLDWRGAGAAGPN